MPNDVLPQLPTGARRRRDPRTRLQAARVSRGIKQEALAARVGVSRNTLNRLENGWNRDPPLRLLVALAAALGIDDWHELAEAEWLEPNPDIKPLPTAADWRAQAEPHNRFLAEKREASREWRQSPRRERFVPRGS